MIYTFFTHEEIEKTRDIFFDATVVIDVLRATSTMVTALANGCLEVLPFFELNDAILFKKKHQDFLLCGERGGVKPDGFELGNSPVEFSKDVVEGKRIIFTTTNGTKALLRAHTISKLVYICSFLNISATVDQLMNYDNIGIICAGNDGYPSYEDTQVAGKIIYELLKKREYELNDSSKIAYNLWNSIGKPDFSGEHAKKLIELGFDKDVEFCQNIDMFDTVVKLFKDNDLVSLRKIENS